MKLSKSKSFEEFEDMCLDILSKQYNSKFTRYARNGQKQNGIDIYSMLNDNSYIVAQCKNYYRVKSVKIFNKNVESALQLTENLMFKINKFIIMTSLDKDKNIQDLIINLTFTFNIKILFWIIKTYFKNITLLFFKGEDIPIQRVNKFISYIEILKERAKYLYNNYNGLQNQYSLYEDEDLYNLCGAMYNAWIEVYDFNSDFFIQLKRLSLADTIDYILKSLPTFGDEN